jgi:hypothetical protein
MLGKTKGASTEMLNPEQTFVICQDMMKARSGKCLFMRAMLT